MKQQKQLLKSVVVRKIAESFNQPIEEMTDRIGLQALIQHYTEKMQKTINDPDRREYIFASNDLEKCLSRVRYLNRLIVVTAPVTPQLNLF